MQNRGYDDTAVISLARRMITQGGGSQRSAIGTALRETGIRRINIEADIKRIERKIREGTRNREETDMVLRFANGVYADIATPEWLASLWDEWADTVDDHNHTEFMNDHGWINVEWYGGGGAEEVMEVWVGPSHRRLVEFMGPTITTTVVVEGNADWMTYRATQMSPMATLYDVQGRQWSDGEVHRHRWDQEERVRAAWERLGVPPIRGIFSVME